MRRYASYAIIILMVCLIGCDRDNGAEYPITDKQYRTGTDGLKFDFIANGPPAKIFESAEFDIVTDAWNKGAYDIEEGYITAIVEEDYMCILDGEECAGFVGEGGTAELNSLRAQRTDILVQLDKEHMAEEAREELRTQLEEIERQIEDRKQGLTYMNPALTRDIVEEEPSGALEGKGVSSPEGNYKRISFKAKAKPLDLLSVQHTSPVILTACYAYATVASVDVCIDPDVSGTRDMDKACETKDITLTDQGAPIAITKVETRILPKGEDVVPQFMIHVDNKGSGKPISEEVLEEACSSAELSHSDWNRVRLESFRFSSDQYHYDYGSESNNIDCSTNPLRLVDGKDTIRCTVNNNKLGEELKLSKQDPSFSTKAFIRLEYGYTESETKNVVIEKVET